MKPKKKLGQNFLISKKEIEKIVKLTSTTNKLTSILEVGPGKGAITIFIDKIFKKVIAIEKDVECYNYLNSKKLTNTFLINSDFFDVDLSKLLTKKEYWIFFSNLPYFIAKKILFEVIKNNQFIEINFMIQKEIGESIFRSSKNKKHDRFSVIINTYFKWIKGINIDASAFSPVPKVNSMFIKMERNNKFLDEDINYVNFIKELFKYKRKILLNVFKKNNLDVERLQKWLILKKYKLNIRAEELLLLDFKELYKMC